MKNYIRHCLETRSEVFLLLNLICLNPVATEKIVEGEGFRIRQVEGPIVKEQVHDVYVHEKTATIMYEFDITALWTSEDMYNEPSIDNNTCQESVALNKFCKEYEGAKKQLIKKLTKTWKVIKQDIDNFPRDLETSGVTSSELAKDLMKRLGEDENKWKLYLRSIEAHHDNLILFEKPEAIFNTSTSDMFESYVNIVRNMDSTGDTEFPSHVAKTLIFEKEKRLTKLGRRLKSGISDCKKRHSPFPNWDWQPFKSSLNRLAENIAKEGLTLAIPVDNYEHYAKLPLADCFFTKSTMRVLFYVPVRRKKINWNLYRVVSLPFVEGGKQYQLPDLELGENIIGEANGKYVIFTAEQRSKCDLRPH